MRDVNDLTSRVDELEFQLVHLQRIYEQLNEVVTEQANIIDHMQLRLTKLESLVTELKQAPEPANDPLDEKPPHY